MPGRSHPTRVPLILGAGAFGAENSGVARVHTIPEAQEIVNRFVANGHKEIDTSRQYGLGTSEEFLGKLDVHGALVDTKNLPVSPGYHSPEMLRSILDESCKALGPHKINVFYLHSPDRSVPYEVMLRGVNELYKEGYFKEFGLSNFYSWEVAEIVAVAKHNGWVRPTVYQGLYNALERHVETELLLCLRKFGIRFYAFSPLAGGLLTGKFLSPKDFHSQPGTRWDMKTSHIASVLGAAYAPLVPAFAELAIKLRKHGITPTAAAQRWLQHHSALGSGDGVIIGVSSLKQLEDNLHDCASGPLPREIVDLFEIGWKNTKAEAPYYTFYNPIKL